MWGYQPYLYRDFQNPCNTVLDLRAQYMEGSELRNFHIRQLLSSELKCSVAGILQNPVAPWHLLKFATTRFLNQSFKATAVS